MSSFYTVIMTIIYHNIPLVFIHRGLRVWGPYQYKDVASQCRDSHYKDEMVWRTCYIYITILIMEITQTWKNGLYIGTEPYILPQCGPYITRLISPKLCEGWDMECFCVLKVWSIVNIGRGRAVYNIQTITGAKLFITTLRPRPNCTISQTSLFQRVQLTIFQHWFRWWLGTDQATSYYLT